MQWLSLQPTLEPLVGDVPELLGTALALSDVANYESYLIDEEVTAHAAMGAMRKLSFSSGRRCVRAAQDAIALARFPVGRAGKEPIWPSGCVGSISHSSSVAVAVVSKSLAGIGLDIESANRVTEKIWPTVFTKNEQTWLSRAPSFCADVMFSAKEAGYKAIFPSGRKFIGFHDAEIHLDLSRQQFRIVYLGQHGPNKLLDSGIGYWHRAFDHILTTFVLE